MNGVRTVVGTAPRFAGFLPDQIELFSSQVLPISSQNVFKFHRHRKTAQQANSNVMR